MQSVARILTANPVELQPGEQAAAIKTEVLFDLVDNLYCQNHGLTVTGNYSMRDLVEHERMHPAIVRRLDDMCRVIEV